MAAHTCTGQMGWTAVYGSLILTAWAGAEHRKPLRVTGGVALGNSVDKPGLQVVSVARGRGPLVPRQDVIVSSE